VKPKAEVTPEELLAMPDGGHYELIDGQLRERKVSVLTNVIAAEITRILGNHCGAHNLGWVLASELGYQCFPWNPRRVRRADVSFMRGDRLGGERMCEGFCSIPPDLAVEIVSPNDLAEKLEGKVEEYLRAGVSLVWVVHPDVHIVHVYRVDGTTSRFRGQDELSGEDVIPGFHCKVDDFFPKATKAEAQSQGKADSGSPAPAS
jgi:Uma2 family endonuclease